MVNRDRESFGKYRIINLLYLPIGVIILRFYKILDSTFFFISGLHTSLWTPHFDCLGGAAVRRRTHDRKVAGSTPGRGAIKSTRSTQPFIPPG